MAVNLGVPNRAVGSTQGLRLW